MKKSGNVLLEMLISMNAWILLSTLLGFSCFGVWAKEFLNIESFYLARTYLYQNQLSCKSSDRIIPQNILERHCSCSPSSADIECHMLGWSAHAKLGATAWDGL